MFGYVILVLLLVIGFAGALRIQAYLTDRAAAQVVGIFRDHRAESVWTARTPEELGLTRRTLMQRLADPRRDYKPIALSILMNISVIRMTGQKKLFLSEKDLAGVCRKTENRSRMCSQARPDTGSG